MLGHVAAAGFPSRYLSGHLPYASLNKTFPSFRLRTYRAHCEAKKKKREEEGKKDIGD